MKKIIKILIIITLIVLLGGIYAFSRLMNKTQQDTQSMITNENEKLEQIVMLVNAYYLNSQEKTFLKSEPIDLNALEVLKEQVNNSNAVSTDKNRVLKEIDIIIWKQNAQDTVNELYNQSSEQVLREDKVLENRVLSNGLTNERMVIIKEEILGNIPQRILAVNEEPIEDRFNMIIAELIEEAVSKVKYYSAAEASFEKVTQITIKDGEIGNIARTMRDFEHAKGKVTDPRMDESLTAQVNMYLQKFLVEFSLIVEEIPGYYDLAIVAVKPSKLLTTLLEENKKSFVTKELEVTIVETTEETVVDTPSSTITTTLPDTTVESSMSEGNENVVPEVSTIHEYAENSLH